MASSTSALDPNTALALILERLPLLSAGTVPLAEAHQRILRETVHAAADYPHGDRVCMDGIAVAWDPGCRRWPIGPRQYAGDAPLRYAGAAIEVATGAIRPLGTDTIIRSEDLMQEGDAWVLRANVELKRGQHLQLQGCEHRAGQELLQPYARLQAPEICLLAALGRTQVLVSAKPRISLISNGSELVPPEQQPLPHQIRECNSLAARACLSSFGYDEIETYHGQDSAEALHEVLDLALARSEVIIISGGVSHGPRDLVRAGLQQLGVQLAFEELRQRPGKPFCFGRGAAGQVVFALPGNPVAALMNLRRYVIPALARMEGCLLPELSLRVVGRHEGGPFTRMIPVQRCGVGEARLMPTQGSGDFTSLQGSDGFVVFPPRDGAFAEGEDLAFLGWSV